MKHLLGCGLLVLAAALSFNASAAGELATCNANIKNLEDRANSTATTHPEVHKMVDEDIASAKKARNAKKAQTCIDITDHVSARLNDHFK